MFHKFSSILNMGKLRNVMCTALLATTAAYAQVGVGTTTPDASAALEVYSTDKVFLPPRLTEAQMDAIANPPEGGIVYCTDCSPKGIYYHDGGGFVSPTTLRPSDFDANTEVYSSTGKVWMDKNLGASQVATSLSDHLAYGSLFQWGRAADGHEVINWTSSTTTDGAEQSRETAITSVSDIPGHDDFITRPTTAGDWRAAANNNLWKGVAGTNNPCPSGFRVPTIAEWTAERDTWSSSDGAGAFASVLKLTFAGVRVNSNGAVIQSGATSGNYWSSTIAAPVSEYFAITNTFALPFTGLGRSYGLSVRCIKD